MLKLKVIKKTPFNTAKAVGTHYVVAYKGRVFSVSSLSYTGEDEGKLQEELDEKGKEPTGFILISGKNEVRVESSVDSLTGEVTKRLAIVPKMEDLSLSEF